MPGNSGKQKGLGGVLKGRSLGAHYASKRVGEEKKGERGRNPAPVDKERCTRGKRR